MIEKELLLDSLREDYAEEITKIINFCQFDGKNYLDVYSLNAGLRSLTFTHFQTDLSEDDWYELVYELAPDIYDELSYGRESA
jgi:hypothetical protein